MRSSPRIEAEHRLVEGNRQPIERMEQKIAATLAHIRGEGAEKITTEVIASAPSVDVT
jgi:hypothetical protein